MEAHWLASTNAIRVALESSIFLVLLLLLLLLSVFSCAGQENDVINTRLEMFEKLFLDSWVGPESITFDHLGEGPYTGVSDGRILKWRGRRLGWAVFATPKQRAEGCDGSDNHLMESFCGRPLGLQFYKATGELYIADAYFGLLSVGPRGGVATQLVKGADDGELFFFTNGVDLDQENGMVYFTDSSTKFRRRDYLLAVLSGDATGRLMKYDPNTKKATVLARGLAFPNGVAMGHDSTFLLLAETTRCRILRYWLRGARAGSLEVFAELPGYPDNIKRISPGEEFWVALNQERLELLVRAGAWSGERPLAVRLSGEGKVVEVLDGKVLTSISEVEERNGSLWLGSVDMPYVGVLGH